MAETVETKVPPVYVSDLEKLAKKVRQVTGKDDTELSFEFIITSLFPTSWTNIQESLSHQYTLGYIQGRKDEEEERKDLNRAKHDLDCYYE